VKYENIRLNLDLSIGIQDGHYEAEFFYGVNMRRVFSPMASDMSDGKCNQIALDSFLIALGREIGEIAFPKVKARLYHMDSFLEKEDSEPIFRFRCNCGETSDTFPKRTTNPIDWPEFQKFKRHECKK